jgi:ABC-type sugar transport system permease subunit
VNRLRRGRSRRTTQVRIAAAGFLAPALLVYGAFMVFPFLRSIYLSLFEWNGLGPKKDFVGLGNYRELLHDSLYWAALRHNVTWAVLGTVAPVCLALLLAMLLRDRPRGYTLFRTVFFMPQVLAPVVVAIIFSWIYDPTFGILSRALRAIGLSGLAQPWVANPSTALYALIAVFVWVEVGFGFVVFLAALEDVNAELLAAAKVDGANVWQSFRHVTLPEISNALTLVIVVQLIAGFNAFDYVWVMTQGGPANSTDLTSTYLYEQAFRQTNVGYGAASTAITLLVAVSVVRLRERAAR